MDKQQQICSDDKNKLTNEKATLKAQNDDLMVSLCVCGMDVWECEWVCVCVHGCVCMGVCYPNGENQHPFSLALVLCSSAYKGGGANSLGPGLSVMPLIGKTEMVSYKCI